MYQLKVKCYKGTCPSFGCPWSQSSFFGFCLRYLWFRVCFLSRGKNVRSRFDFRLNALCKTVLVTVLEQLVLVLSLTHLPDKQQRSCRLNDCFVKWLQNDFSSDSMPSHFLRGKLLVSDEMNRTLNNSTHHFQPQFFYSTQFLVLPAVCTYPSMSPQLSNTSRGFEGNRSRSYNHSGSSTSSRGHRKGSRSTRGRLRRHGASRHVGVRVLQHSLPLQVVNLAAQEHGFWVSLQGG